MTSLLRDRGNIVSGEASALCPEFNATGHERRSCTLCTHQMAIEDYAKTVTDRIWETHFMYRPDGLADMFASLRAVPGAVTASFSTSAATAADVGPLHGVGSGPNIVLSQELLKAIWVQLGRPYIGFEASDYPPTPPFRDSESFDELQQLRNSNPETWGDPSSFPSVVELASHVVNNVRDAAGDTLFCSICLEDMKLGEMARSLPTCHHTFHMDCVDIWFTRNHSCPMCRQSI